MLRADEVSERTNRNQLLARFSQHYTAILKKKVLKQKEVILPSCLSKFVFLHHPSLHILLSVTIILNMKSPRKVQLLRIVASSHVSLMFCRLFS